MIACDFCGTVFCFDCPNPPFTSLPNERWMCPLHVEPFLVPLWSFNLKIKTIFFQDSHLLSSRRVTDRLALWKEHTTIPASAGPLCSDIVFNFLKKITDENEQINSVERQQIPAPTNHSRKTQRTTETFKVHPLVKRAYEVAERRRIDAQKQRMEVEESSSSDEPIDIGSAADVGAFFAAEALVNMHSQQEMKWAM